jgi:hypothetical protein
MPGDDIERLVIHSRAPKAAQELAYQLAFVVEIFVASMRCLEIPRVRESVRADGPEIRELERGAEVFTNVTARGARRQNDAKAQAARNDGDFLRFDVQPSELRIEVEAAKLRHDEQLAIGAVEKSPVHGSIGGIQMDRAS